MEEGLKVESQSKEISMLKEGDKVSDLARVPTDEEVTKIIEE